MTTETDVMAILGRANPVPPGELVEVPAGATRYLATVQEHRSESMTIVDPTPPTTTRSRRWPAVSIAASIVALVAGVALVTSNTDDAADQAPADAPTTVVASEPTVPPTNVAASTTLPAADVETALAVVDELFAAYNAGDTDAVLGMMAPDVVWTTQYGSGRPNPDDEGVGLADVELHLAWNHAQGEVWTQPTCAVADEQRPAGTTLTCRWDTLDAVVRAVDGAPIPTTAWFVVNDGMIVEVHDGYGSPDFGTLGVHFNRWMEANHPEIDGALCCDGDTRDESEQRGRLRAEWSHEWGRWLDANGCEAGHDCRIPLDQWVGEYAGNCEPGENGLRFPSRALYEHMVTLPPPDSNTLQAQQLLAVDKTLSSVLGSPGTTGEMVDQRRELLTVLGLDTCIFAP